MAVLVGVELLTLLCCLEASSCRGQVHVPVLDEVRDIERGVVRIPWRRVWMSTKRVEELVLKARSEAWIRVRNERQWHAMKTEDVVTEGGSDLDSRD